MEIKIGNQTFSEAQLKQMAEQLDKNCAKSNAHGYHKFLKETKLNNTSLIEFIRELQKLSAKNKYNESGKLNLTEQQQFNLTIEFFKNLDEKLGALVESILSRKNKNYKLKIDPNGHAHAGHNNKDDFIEIVVDLNGTLGGFVTLPHELAHAVSTHHTKLLDLVSNIKTAEQTRDKQQFEKAENEFNIFTKSLGEYNKDCVGEIESHIVERLFYRFLLKNGVITDADYQNYRVEAMNSFNSNLNQVSEEYQVLSHLPCPITFDAAMEYAQKLLAKKSYNLLGRMHTMADPDPKHDAVKSEYAMRYIVAEIVATEWMEIYEQCNKNERQQMKQQFVEYLSKTADFNVEDATQFLLNKSLVQTIEDFLSALQTNANYGC